MFVLKFGGTSVGSPDRIKNVAKIIARYTSQPAKPKVVVVVSAMGDTTDELIDLANRVSPNAHLSDRKREMDMLLTSGERISMALLSLALADLGIPAQSFTGSQSGIMTNTVHREARIAEIRPYRVIEALEKGRVAIVAGFQGVSSEKEITTLGRGGSDTTAVALGAALKAQTVFIYTDVDGVFSADPRKISNAKHLPELPWNVALELAARGAQVLHPRCVEIAAKFNVGLIVRNSFSDSLSETTNKQTRVLNPNELKEATMLESPKILAVTLEDGLRMKDFSVRNVSSPEKFSAENYHSIKTIYKSAGAKQFALWGDESGNWARISILGVSLLSYPTLIEDVTQKLKSEGVGVESLHVVQTSTLAEFVFEVPAGFSKDKIHRDLHEAFIAA